MPNRRGRTTTEENPSAGILCAKCEHLNPGKLSECERCGSHLYIACKDCGQRTARNVSRCSNCGRRMHRTWFQKLEKKLFKRSAKINLIQIVLLVLAVYATYKVIVKIAEYEPPQGP